MKRKIIALTQPIVDLVATDISDDLLNEALKRFGNEGTQKSMTSIIDTPTRKEFLAWIKENNIAFALESGGSSANSAHGCKLLGADVLVYGCLGNDSYAKIFKDDLDSMDMIDKTTTADFATSLCFSLVTKDGERTMFTNIEASNFIQPDVLKDEHFALNDVLLLEGYMFYVPLEGAKQTIDTAIDLAKANGTKVALSLSDPFCVTVNKERFTQLIDGNKIDVIFANEEEAKTYTGKATAEEALEVLSQKAELVAVTLGEKGSLIFAEGQVTKIAPAIVPKEQIIDATGVGDIYAATVLCGLIYEKQTLEVGDLASRLAAEVLTQRGARLKQPEGLQVGGSANAGGGCCGQPEVCGSHG